MIRFLRGELVDKLPERIEVDVQGVGYGVFISAATYAELPAIGEQVKIFTHFQVREDGQALYGFSSVKERDLFQTLLTVSGVGPKVAIGILSAITPPDFCAAIAREEAATLSRLPGIGKKTAQRLILELKDKIGKLSEQENMTGVDVPTKGGHRQEVLAALVALGYGAAEAEKAAGFTEDAGGELSVEEWLKKALRVLAR